LTSSFLLRFEGFDLLKITKDTKYYALVSKSDLNNLGRFTAKR